MRLGVDAGDARVGIARSDPDGVLAIPVETVPVTRSRRGARRDLPHIARLVREYEVIEVIVGLPRSLSGGEGPAATKVRAYAVRLARLIRPVPVRLVDERLTTVAATRELRETGVRGPRRAAIVDQAAAVIILQNALDSERASGEPPGGLVQLGDRPDQG